MDQLDLKNAVLVGHSTGGGEVTRYIGRHGTKRVAKAVLISAIPPLLLKTGANPREFRQKCGMASAPVSPRILPSSTKTSLRPGGQTSFPLAVRQVLSAERQSNGGRLAIKEE